MVWRGQAKNISFIGGSIVLLLSPSIANLRFSPFSHYHILVLYVVMWRNNSWFCERLPLCQGRGVPDFSGGLIVTLFRMTRLDASFFQSTVHLHAHTYTRTMCTRTPTRESVRGEGIPLVILSASLERGERRKTTPLFFPFLPFVSVSSLAHSYTVYCSAVQHSTLPKCCHILIVAIILIHNIFIDKTFLS